MFQCLQVTSHLCSSSHYYPTYHHYGFAIMLIYDPSNLRQHLNTIKATMI